MTLSTPEEWNHDRFSHFSSFDTSRVWFGAFFASSNNTNYNRSKSAKRDNIPFPFLILHRFHTS